MASIALSFNNVDLTTVDRKLKHGVGYNTKGKYKKSINGTTTIVYSAWANMINRCYCEKTQTERPTYIGCSVVAEWHDFQVFAEWFENHDYSELGYQLDKDLLFAGNKVYGPDTCCLIPRELNILLVDHGRARGKYPIGVYFHKATGKFASRIRINSKDTFLGYFARVEDAHETYVKAKEAYVKNKALEWRDRVSRDVFEALINWRVAKN